MAVLQEGTTNIPQQTFEQWNDPYGTELIGFNRDGTIYCQGVNIPASAPANSVVPIVQAKLQMAGTTSAASISATAIASVMYAVSLYLESAGGAGVGHTVVVMISYTSPIGVHTITLTLTLDVAEVVMETYPLLAAAGSIISIAAAYGGGATNDPYTISARIVQMP